MMSFRRRTIYYPAWAVMIVAFAIGSACLAADGPSVFVRLLFGSDVSIEVPRNWTFLNQNIRQHLNTYSEAVAKFSGIDVNQGNNQILLAANAYTVDKKPSATLRLSVRVGRFSFGCGEFLCTHRQFLSC